MLELVSSKELIMKPRSDETLSGSITIANNSKGCFIAYKVKSTNPHLFSVEPNRGMLQYKQTENIQVNTIDAINNVMAKQLSQKHKFLVEYVILDRQPHSIEEGVSKIYGSAAQSFRVYINTDSIRSSRFHSPARQESEIASNLSNKYSFHSAFNDKNDRNRSSNGKGFFRSNLVNSAQSQVNNHPDTLDQLKTQVESLQMQRSELMLGTGKKKSKGSGFLKKLIVLIIGVVAGNMGAKSLGLTQMGESILNSSEGQWEILSAEEEESSGWF